MSLSIDTGDTDLDRLCVPWTLYFGYRVYPGPCTLNTVSTLDPVLWIQSLPWTLYSGYRVYINWLRHYLNPSSPPWPPGRGCDSRTPARRGCPPSGDVWWRLTRTSPPSSRWWCRVSRPHWVSFSHSITWQLWQDVSRLLTIIFTFTSWKYFTFTEVNIVIFLEIFSQFYPGAGQLVMSLSVSITSLRLSLKYQTRLQSRAVTWYHKLSPAQTSLSS